MQRNLCLRVNSTLFVFRTAFSLAKEGDVLTAVKTQNLSMILTFESLPNEACYETNNTYKTSIYSWSLKGICLNVNKKELIQSQKCRDPKLLTITSEKLVFWEICSSDLMEEGPDTRHHENKNFLAKEAQCSVTI